MILVAGATGLLGGLIANRLLDAGAPTAILVREGSDHSALDARGPSPARATCVIPTACAAPVRASTP